jgi:AcrR family transcriptional regulator
VFRFFVFRLWCFALGVSPFSAFAFNVKFAAAASSGGGHPMDDLPKPRWERRKEARPAELLAAALALFVERGFAGTRLDDVAARAGVSKGTLYLYFENKEDLFKAVVRENIVRRVSEARAALADHRGSTADLLGSMLRSWWHTTGESPASGIVKLIVAESGNFPELTRFYADEVIHPVHQLASDVIRRGIERGEFRPVAVETFVRVMIAPLVMLTLWQHSFGPCSAIPTDVPLYLQTHLQMVMAALAPEVAAPGAASCGVKRRLRRIVGC